MKRLSGSHVPIEVLLMLLRRQTPVYWTQTPKGTEVDACLAHAWLGCKIEWRSKKELTSLWDCMIVLWNAKTEHRKHLPEVCHKGGRNK